MQGVIHAGLELAGGGYRIKGSIFNVLESGVPTPLMRSGASMKGVT